MLAKQHRLVKQKDFERVFKQGRAYHTKLLGIKILASQLDSNRFGIVISTKISKKSTERNRLKRQIRQAVRELNKGLRSDFDMVIMALPGILNQNYQGIKSELEKVFTGLKIYK